MVWRHIWTREVRPHPDGHCHCPQLILELSLDGNDHGWVRYKLKHFSPVIISTHILHPLLKIIEQVNNLPWVFLAQVKINRIKPSPELSNLERRRIHNYCRNACLKKITTCFFFRAVSVNVWWICWTLVDKKLDCQRVPRYVLFAFLIQLFFIVDPFI